MHNRIARKTVVLLSCVGLWLAVGTTGQALAQSVYVQGTCSNASSNGTYFSGTKGAANCNWLAATGDTLDKIQCWVNGVKRYELTFSPPKPQRWPGGAGPYGVPYFTTQFADNASLTFKACFWSTNGQYLETTDSTSHTTYNNKAYILGNQNTSYGSASADNVKSQCQAMNHTADKYTTHTKATIRSNLPTYTVFYSYTHGGYNVAPYYNLTSFADCTYQTGDDISTHCLSSTEVSSDVGGKSSSQPAYNIVHIDACMSGAYNDMAKAFKILSAGGGTVTNRRTSAGMTT